MRGNPAMRKQIELIMAVCLILTALFAATHGVREAGSSRAVEGMKVMIDAGHGGNDPGKVAADGSLEKDINDGIKAAMLAKEKVRLAALRAVKAEILLAKTADGSEDISDDKVLKIIQKLVKQRKESAAVYSQNGREELAKNELDEAAVLEVYMPKQLSGAELENALKAIIEQVGATSPADMGKVMGVATKQLAGQADGRAISEAVKTLLKR